MSAPKTISIPTHLVDLATRYLLEHATILQEQKFDASAQMVRGLAAEIADITAVQSPQTVDQADRSTQPTS
jgi:hypothetical protein